MQEIRARFDEQGALSYAASLACVAHVPLVIEVQVPPQYKISPTLEKELLQRAHAQVCENHPGAAACDLRVELKTSDTTGYHFVSNTPEQLAPFQWYPAGERVVREPYGPVFAPIGNDESALPGTLTAIEIARHIGLPLVFYHTTWRNESLDPADPRAHACESALALIQRAEQEARRADVHYETIVETAPSIAEGVHLTALRRQAFVIAMMRDAAVLAGDTVDQLLARHVVPLLITR